jgi:hypothetical protein
MHPAVTKATAPVLMTLAAILLASLHHGCTPGPSFSMMSATYDAEVMKCVTDSDTPQKSCECRKSLDEKYGLCDHPEWPRMGRCDYMCDRNWSNVPYDAGIKDASDDSKD